MFEKWISIIFTLQLDPEYLPNQLSKRNHFYADYGPKSKSDSRTAEGQKEDSKSEKTSGGLKSHWKCNRKLFGDIKIFDAESG